jgi:hypothetical protein
MNDCPHHRGPEDEVADLRPRGAGWTVRLHEKGGKEHASRAITRSPKSSAPIAAAGIAKDPKGWLFRPARGHKADTLSDLAMNQFRRLVHDPPPRRCDRHHRTDRVPYAWRNRDHRLPRQRRRTGACAGNGRHQSPRTTKLYDRTKERLTQDEVERIRL